MNLWPPVLAADIGGLIAIAFLAISFIGWLANLINGQNHPPPPQRRGQRPLPQRPRDERIRNEIEVFLKQAAGERGERAGGERADRGRVSKNDIEVVEGPRERRRPPARPAPRRRPPAQKPPVTAAQVESPAPSLRDRHLESQVSLEHPEVAAAIEVPQVSEADAARNARSADWARAFDLAPEARNEELQEVMQSLRDPVGIRRAILINEILLPPLSRR